MAPPIIGAANAPRLSGGAGGRSPDRSHERRSASIRAGYFRRWLWFCLVFVWFLAFIACSPVRSASETPHRWLKRDITYWLNAEANSITETAVRQTFDRWDELTPFSFTYGGRHRAGLRKDGKNTVSFLTKWPAEIPIGQVAYCKNWYDRNGSIVESDIIFNMQVTRFTTNRTNKPDSYYVEGVLSHEIGHLLGLGHEASSDSLMKQKSAAEESYFKGEIDTQTLSALERLYGSPDSDR